jgi:inosine-uridine nucleoside N-ribohydrolase
MPKPMIIDTDVAFDDWMAILFLLHSPRVAIRALTVAATGEAHAGPGMQTLVRLLALSRHAHVPVAAGRQMPLVGKHTFPLALRLIMDVRFGLKLPNAHHLPAKEAALQILLQQLRSTTEPTEIVALGPLTNLAELLLTEPSLARKISMITIMGGAFDVPGNIPEVNKAINNPHAEWNIYIDPYALDVLLRSGVPITMVPLDVTNQYQLTPAFIERLRQQQHTATAQFLLRALQRLARIISTRPYYFWDPLTAVVAAAPEVATFEESHIRVIQEEGPQAGRTIRDPQGYPVLICVAVDAGVFEQTFLETINTAHTPS